MTSWEVLVLHPLFAFSVNFVITSPAAVRFPSSLFFFSLYLSLAPGLRDPQSLASGGRRASTRRRNDGRPGPKTEGLEWKQAKFESAGGTKRACLFATSICSSRAFRRYITLANPAGGSKVTASTGQAGPRDPPIRKSQIVSLAIILRVRSYQR